jgi:hypothetical protein
MINNKVLIWLKGLLSAAISSAAGSVGLVIIEPQTFNLQEGLSKLGTVAAALAIVAVANYLKKSPLPE